MPWDFKFDPVTRDFIRDGGSFVRTRTADTLVMHQVVCKYRKCWHDENLGSQFDDLNYLQSNPTLRATQEAKRCLGVLVSRGRIANLEVTAEMHGPGRVVTATKFRDTSSGQVVAVTARTGA